ncbi:MAG: MFS transporter [Rhizobiales bacterium]|nr:MFS transporter [Hyphomicrobiales bacterium]
MSSESEIPTRSHSDSRRFAVRLAVFYGTLFGLVGTHLPFFPVWLKAVGIDASWIGIIIAVPAVTRFTTLPFVTGLAEQRQTLRGAIIATAFLTAIGFSIVGLFQVAVAVFAAYVFTACVWTPMVPLTDGYALKGVARYGLNYGPLRLWGSAAFIAGALVCGLLVDVIAPQHLIWVIAAMATVGAIAGLGLRPIDMAGATPAGSAGATGLLRQPGFLAIIVASALIQGSHAAYYAFASITWQATGFGGLTIAGLWVLGVIAEIVVFALSPRFTVSPVLLVIIGASSAIVRWLVTAQEPSVGVLVIAQLMHGLTYGATLLGTMGLLMRNVPSHVAARAQGYLAACSGIVASSASMLSGAIYAQHGQGVYYVMAAMGAAGGLVIVLARHRVDGTRALVDQPQSAGSGG